MTADLTKIPRTTTREKWKKYYRALRKIDRYPHGLPQWRRHYWRDGKRVLDLGPAGNYVYQSLDVRPYGWMTLLEDINVIAGPTVSAEGYPLIAILCHHARMGHDYIRNNLTINERLTDRTYIASFASGMVAFVVVVVNEEQLRGIELHSYEVIGPVSSRMIDIARSRIR